MIEVGFAQLHGDIFLNGKNLTNGSITHNLDSFRNPELSMVYDKVEKELLVTWKGMTAHVPSTNVASYIPGPAFDRKTTQVTSPMVANIAATAQIQTPGVLSAQVETPMSHVKAGPGKGKTGINK